MSTISDPSTAKVQPLRRPGLYWALADAWVLAKRRLRQIPRIPDEIIFATIQPVMFVLLFRYVFGGAIHVARRSYVNYLMAGIFIQTIIFGATTTGVGLAQDLEKGLIDRFRSLPMAKSAVLTGRTLADLVRNFVVVIVMLVVGLLVGFRPQGSPLGWLAAFGIILLVSFAFSWISATIGLLVHSVEAAQSAGFIWLFPLTFASPAFVTVKTIPATGCSGLLGISPSRTSFTPCASGFWGSRSGQTAGSRWRGASASSSSSSRSRSGSMAAAWGDSQ